MSYRIQYGPDRPGRGQEKRSAFGVVGVVIVAAVCALALGFALPEQAGQLREVLFPWAQPEVKSAFSELTGELRSGVPLSDALAGFCREILDEASTAQ